MFNLGGKTMLLNENGNILKLMIFALIIAYIGIIGKFCYADTSNPVNLGEAAVKAKNIKKKERERKKVFKSSFSESLITKKQIKAVNNPKCILKALRFL